MKREMNVNVLLCREFDANSKSILNIINTIKTNRARRASFVIFVAVSERCEDCSESGEFALHFFLEKKDGERKGLNLYLGSMQASYCKNDSKDASSSVIGNFEVKDIKFLYDGAYQVKVYYSDVVYNENFDKYAVNKREIKTIENLISKYDVEVEFS